MPPLLASRLALVAALLIVAIGVLGALQPPIVVCGELAKGYAPILAFEFARSVADLHALFGDAPSDCRTTLVAGLNRVNLGDNLLFIPTYGAFLVLSLLALRPRFPQRALVAIACVVIACAFDYAENACLGPLAVNPDLASSWLALLPWATGGKWLLLAVGGALGGSMLGEKPAIRWLATVACALGLVVILLVLALPHVFGRFASVAVGVSWIALLLADVSGARQNRST